MSTTPKWTKVKTTTVYKGFVTINRDTYEEPNGAVTDWDVIAGRDSAATLAFTPSASHVVLFEQFRVGPGKALLELPGGYVNSEEEPVDAALRELREETGYHSESAFYADAGLACRGLAALARCTPDTQGLAELRDCIRKMLVFR